MLNTESAVKHMRRFTPATLKSHAEDLIMALQAKVTDEELSTLKGKTIIITGGASGIGRAAVNLAHSS